MIAPWESLLSSPCMFLSTQAWILWFFFFLLSRAKYFLLNLLLNFSWCYSLLFMPSFMIINSVCPEGLNWYWFLFATLTSHVMRRTLLILVGKLLHTAHILWGLCGCNTVLEVFHMDLRWCLFNSVAPFLQVFGQTFIMFNMRLKVYSVVVIRGLNQSSCHVLCALLQHT